MVAGGWALAQLWLFWVAPIVGALAGLAYPALFGEKKERAAPTMKPPQPTPEPSPAE